MVWHRSSAIPHSLLVVDSAFSHNWCLCCHQMEQFWRMWWTVCSASLQLQSAHSPYANLFQVRSQTTVSCLQPQYCGLLMPCQTVDWVCRGVVDSSGPSPLAFLTVSEQGFGFLVSEGGQGLQLFAPKLGQAICSFISWNPTVSWDPL